MATSQISPYIFLLALPPIASFKYKCGPNSNGKVS